MPRLDPWNANKRRYEHGIVSIGDRRETLPDTYDPLHARFDFSLDAAADRYNHKCGYYFSTEKSAFEHRWNGRVWCNPPFSMLPEFVARARDQASNCELIVMIIPANRTEQPFWQTHVEPYRDRGWNLTTEFLPTRRKFRCPNGGPIDAPPFGVVLLIWRRPTMPSLTNATAEEFKAFHTLCELHLWAYAADPAKRPSVLAAPSILDSIAGLYRELPKGARTAYRDFVAGWEKGGITVSEIGT